MDLRSLSLKLLQQEQTMLSLQKQPLHNVPDLKADAQKVIKVTAGLAALALFRFWATAYRQTHENFLSTILRPPIGLSTFALVVLGGAFLVFLLGVFADLCRAKKARRYNQELHNRSLAAQKEYDTLRQEAIRLKQADPALAGKHFFFDDPHPLESELSTLSYDVPGTLHLIGELAAHLIPETRVRLDGYYGPKCAFIREMEASLQDPQHSYLRVFWDKDYIDSHPDAQCKIHTLIRARLTPSQVKTSTRSDHLRPLAGHSGYYRAARDRFTRFVRFGTSSTTNFSEVEDLRTKSMAQHIADCQKKLEETRKQEPHRTRYSTDYPYNACRAEIQPMGYQVLTGDGARTLAVIVPRFPMQRFHLNYALDLYHSQEHAATQLIGTLIDWTQDEGSVPDLSMILQGILPRTDLPEFDPLQERPANFPAPEWHAMLRRLAAKQAQ